MPDFGGEGGWMYIIPIAILVAVSFLMRRRGGMGKAESTPVEIASGLLLEVRENQRTVEATGPNMRPKKLTTGSWERNGAKVGFLGEPLRKELSQAFHLSEDYNLQVESAKKFKSVSYVSVVNVDKLKRSLANSSQGLEGWVKANMDQQGPTQQQRQGCLFGG